MSLSRRRPKKVLMRPASNAIPKLSRYDASTRGAVTASKNAGQVMLVDLIMTADSGIKTISDRYTMVYPRERPNPGKIEVFFVLNIQRV
mgnify:CR=1 FL=1